jgi:hypothetical protein
MPTVAIVDGVRIQFYPRDHPPPHFHAEFAEYRATIDIRSLRVVRGSLARGEASLGRSVGIDKEGTAAHDVRQGDREATTGSGAMNALLPRIVSVEPVIYGVIKLVWNDGFEGVVDLRPVISDGEVFEYLRNPTNFPKVAVSEYGHSIFWIDDTGYEIDFGADQLREDAAKQAELHRLAG